MRATVVWAAAAGMLVVGVLYPAAALLLGCLVLMPLAFRGRLRRHVALLALLKAVVVAVGTLGAWILTEDGLLPGQADQYWYLTTAERVSHDIASRGTVLIDYDRHIEVHNRSYNMVLGVVHFVNNYGIANRSGYHVDIVIYRLMNFVLSMMIAVFSMFIVKEIFSNYSFNYRYSIFVLWIVGMMPYINIYSMMITRDVMLAFLFVLYIWSLTKNKVALALLVTGVMYYTRMQLGLILAVGVGIYVAALFLTRTRRGAFVKTVALLGLAAVSAFGATVLVPSLGYVSYHLSPTALLGALLALPTSVVGLDFIFAPDSALELSRTALLFSRLVAPDTVLVPLLFFVFACLRTNSSMDTAHLRIMIVFISMFAMYTFGYYIEYGGVFARLVSPFYPVMVALSIPLWERGVSRVARWVSPRASGLASASAYAPPRGSV